MAATGQQIEKCKNCGASYLHSSAQSTGKSKLCSTCTHLVPRKLVDVPASTPSLTSVDTTQPSQRRFEQVLGNYGSITLLSADLGANSAAELAARFEADFFLFAFGMTVEKVPITEVVEVVLIDEESRKSITSAIARGVVGASLLGLVGAGAGIASAKNHRDVTIGVRFRDGRSFVGTTNSAVANRLQAFMFVYKPDGDQALANEPKASKENMSLKVAMLAAAFILTMIAVVLWLM